MPPSRVLGNACPPREDVAAARRSGAVRRLAAAVIGLARRKSFASVLDQGVVSGASFVTAVIIGRLGSREELGIYALALSLVRFVSGVQSELVCSPYIVFNVHRKGEALAAYTGSSLLHHLVLSSLWVAALVVLATVLSLGVGPGGLAPVAWTLAAVLPFLVLRDYLRQLSLTHLRVTAALVLDVCVTVLQLGGLLILAFCQRLSVSGAFAVAGSACALACLGWLLIARQPLRLVPAQVGADWKQNWSFSRWTLAGFLVGTSTPYFMPWILALTHGEAATGVLAACATLVNFASTYVMGMINVVSPRAVAAYAREGADGLRTVMRRTVILFVLTVGPFCLFIIASGDLSVRLLYGNKYAGCGVVLALLALNALANSLSITAGNGLWALGRARANFLADVCALLVTWSVLLSTVGPLGAVGAALALLAGAVSGAVARTVILLRLLAAARVSPDQECA